MHENVRSVLARVKNFTPTGNVQCVYRALGLDKRILVPSDGTGPNGTRIVVVVVVGKRKEKIYQKRFCSEKYFIRNVNKYPYLLYNTYGRSCRWFIPPGDGAHPHPGQDVVFPRRLLRLRRLFVLRTTSDCSRGADAQ